MGSRKLLYRLASGEQTLENTRLSMTPTQDRYWQLDIDQSGGGLGQDPTTVYVFWQARNNFV